MGQRGYDQFHEHSDRIYRVYSDFKAGMNASSQLYATAPISLGEVLKENYPGVRDAVLIQEFGGIASSEHIEAQLSGYVTDAAFFRMFDFDLEQGNLETALLEPHTIILSPSAATRFFGNISALGQTLTIDNQLFRVTGVLKEVGEPTHFDFEAVMSFASRRESEEHQWMFENWHLALRQSYIFLLLEEGVKSTDIAGQFPAIIERYYPQDDNVWLEGLHMQALTEINLGKQMGNQLSDVLSRGVVIFLGLLCAIVMLAACFNFVNLSVARALTRAKEVGMRKVSGARRIQIIGQFLAEALVVSLASLVVAIGLLSLLVPYFNSLVVIQLTEGTVAWGSLDMVQIALLFAGFCVLIGLGAGFYPALYLSRFAPSRVLKGDGGRAGTSRMYVRNTLVVVQVVVSFVFLFTSIVIYNQFRLIVEADYGFNPGGIVNVRLQGVPYDVFRQEVERIPGVEEVSGISLLPMGGTRSDVWIKTNGMEQPEKGYRLSMDYSTLENLQMTLVAGRNVSPDFPADSGRSVLLNERAVRRLNLGSAHEAVGQHLTLYEDWGVQVVGIVEDFQTSPMMRTIDPIVIDYAPSRFRYANLQIREENQDVVMSKLEETWESLQSPYPIEYEAYESFIHDGPSMRFFQNALGIIGFIAALAIGIACLGILGIATYSVERRTKEVGIRKVLGASVAHVVVLLSKDFMSLIGIALAVAIPVAWLINTSWLEQYEVRTSLGLPVFLIGALIMVGLVIMMIGAQTIQAALRDPVNTLRYE